MLGGAIVVGVKNRLAPVGRFDAPQQWPETHALHDAGDGDASVVEHGRAEVDVHAKPGARAAGFDIFWIPDDERHLERLLEDEPFVVHVVLAQPVALVAGVDDERVVECALGLQVVEHALDVVVDRGDAAKVFVDEMLVGERAALGGIGGALSQVVLVNEVKTFRSLVVVHDGVMLALEQRAGFGDVLVQAGRLGNLHALVQLGPALGVLEILVWPLEVQAQVKRFFGVALLEPLERPVGVAIGVVALVQFAGAVGSVQGWVEVAALANGHRVVADAARELLHVPLADDARLVAAVGQLADVARSVRLEAATEVERAGDV